VLAMYYTMTINIGLITDCASGYNYFRILFFECYHIGASTNSYVLNIPMKTMKCYISFDTYIPLSNDSFNRCILLSIKFSMLGSIAWRPKSQMSIRRYLVVEFFISSIDKS
jgi:hypothetical protein